jgi:hypothetical protein
MVLRAVLCLLVAFVPLPSIAEPVYFPQAIPSRGTVNVPDWMAQGSGDDGYVQVTAEVRLPVGQTCIPLGRKAYLRSNTDVQLVLSVTTFGFGSALDAREVPLATFDSRGATGECISPVKLPVAVVPLTRLETRPPENPGQLRILLNVRSSTNTSLKIVEKAQVALGAISIVATGGGAATVAGLSSALASSAVAPVVKEFEQYASNVTAGTATVPLDWIELRKAPRTYTFQIYEGEAGIGEDAGDAIRRLQTGSTNPSLARFEVQFSVSFVRSIFDTAPVAPHFYPHIDLRQRALVLNYPMHNPAIPNLLQSLNSSSPSLLARVAAGSSLTDICNDVSAKLLREVGLSAVDRVVATKVFVDEALKDEAWLNTDAFDKCFQDQSAAKDLATKLFGVSPRQTGFTVGDMQRDNTPDFNEWKSQIEAPMADFRRVMIAKGPKERLLMNIFRGNDVSVGVHPKNSQWPEPVAKPSPSADAPKPSGDAVAAPAGTESGFDATKSPGIARLAAKPFILGGCFVWAFAADKNVGAGAIPKAHLLLAGDTNDVWLANLTFSQAQPRIITAVTANELDSTEADWIAFFRQRRFSDNAQCAKILKMLPNT